MIEITKCKYICCAQEWTVFANRQHDKIWRNENFFPNEFQCQVIVFKDRHWLVIKKKIPRSLKKVQPLLHKVPMTMTWLWSKSKNIFTFSKKKWKLQFYGSAKVWRDGKFADKYFYLLLLLHVFWNRRKYEASLIFFTSIIYQQHHP